MQGQRAAITVAYGFGCGEETAKAEAKRLLAGVQQEIAAAHAGVHAMHRPACRGCGGVCRVKDYRRHGIATLFGQVTVRLPRFRCGGVPRPRWAWIGRHTHARRRNWIGCAPSFPP